MIFGETSHKDALGRNPPPPRKPGLGSGPATATSWGTFTVFRPSKIIS